MALNPTQLRARALACLAQREHSRQELQRKLLAAWQRAAERAQAVGGSEPVEDEETRQVEAALRHIAEVLDQLTAQGLLCEQRYIDSRLRTRSPRLGARRLSAELAQHGLKPEGDTWAEITASEAERAAALLLRRFGDTPPPDARERARRVRFLVARGFPTGLAVSLVEGKRQ